MDNTITKENTMKTKRITPLERVQRLLSKGVDVNRAYYIVTRKLISDDVRKLKVELSSLGHEVTS